MSGPLSSSSHARSCTLLPVERGSFLFFISIRRFYDLKLEKRKLIQCMLIYGMCLFEDGIGVARRRPVARALLRSSQSSIMSFREVKRRGNPLNRNKNRLTIATTALALAPTTAQRICAISSSKDKNSCHSCAKLSAWWKSGGTPTPD